MTTLPETSPEPGKTDKGSVTFAVLVCLVASLGGLLIGYDIWVMNGAIGFMESHFQFTAREKSWAAGSALLGCVLGAIMAGTLSDNLGRKKVLILSALLFLISAIGSALPREVTEFLMTGYPLTGEQYRLCLPESSVFPLLADYRILGGLGVGAASMTSPMYIAEISPARIRGRLVSVNQFAIVLGMLAVYLVNYFIAGGSLDKIGSQAGAFGQWMFGGGAAAEPTTAAATTTAAAVTTTTAATTMSAADLWNQTTGWRWMFGSEAIPAGLLLVLMFFVPETPRFLAARGKRDKALSILTRVNGPVEAEKEMRGIEYVIAQETGGIGMLFQPGLKVVLVIGVALAILQQVTGISVFLYYGTDILTRLESPVDAALLMNVAVAAVSLLFTAIAIWTVDKLGRKPLMILGSLGMGGCLVGTGLAFCWQSENLWTLGFMLGYFACFALSVGPVTWVILSEIFPTKIRGRAMAIATSFLWIAYYAVSQTFPILDGNKFLVDMFRHGFPFFLYAFFCLVTIVLVWGWVPETKGRSLEQIEEHWIRK